VQLLGGVAIVAGVVVVRRGEPAPTSPPAPEVAAP
jgi:hypothetical protein